MRAYLDGMGDAEAELVCRKTRAELVRNFGDVHELVLLGMPCDSELTYDLGYIRDVFGSRSRRVLHRKRVVNLLDRFHNDPVVVQLIWRVIIA